MTDALDGEHPKRLIARGKIDQFVERMRDALLQITRAFAPRPVVYRTMDFRSNEFRGLTGGKLFEPAEENPMIGYRGCYHYVRDPELFALELRTLAKVRDETPNLHLIPFVRTRWELEACLEAIAANPLGADCPQSSSRRRGRNYRISRISTGNTCSCSSPGSSTTPSVHRTRQSALASSRGQQVESSARMPPRHHPSSWSAAAVAAASPVCYSDRSASSAFTRGRARRRHASSVNRRQVERPARRRHSAPSVIGKPRYSWRIADDRPCLPHHRELTS